MAWQDDWLSFWDPAGLSSYLGITDSPEEKRAQKLAEERAARQDRSSQLAATIYGRSRRPLAKAAMNAGRARASALAPMDDFLSEVSGGRYQAPNQEELFRDPFEGTGYYEGIEEAERSEFASRPGEKEWEIWESPGQTSDAIRQHERAMQQSEIDTDFRNSYGMTQAQLDEYLDEGNLREAERTARAYGRPHALQNVREYAHRRNRRSEAGRVE